MTAEEEKLMRILEARITQLILDFKDLESKNAMLAEQLQKTEVALFVAAITGCVFQREY